MPDGRRKGLRGSIGLVFRPILAAHQGNGHFVLRQNTDVGENAIFRKFLYQVCLFLKKEISTAIFLTLTLGWLLH